MRVWNFALFVWNMNQRLGGMAQVLGFSTFLCTEVFLEGWTRLQIDIKNEWSKLDLACTGDFPIANL